jgi:hypothetical protein
VHLRGTTKNKLSQASSISSPIRPRNICLEKKYLNDGIHKLHSLPNDDSCVPSIFRFGYVVTMLVPFELVSLGLGYTGSSLKICKNISLTKTKTVFIRIIRPMPTVNICCGRNSLRGTVRLENSKQAE